MDPNDGRSQPPPEARGEADLAPTTEFRAFLAGDPIPTDAVDGPPGPAGVGRLAGPPQGAVPEPLRRLSGHRQAPSSGTTLRRTSLRTTRNPLAW